jgi:hypothetical protein
MKKIITVAALILCAATNNQASAASNRSDIDCHSALIADGGYIFNVSADRKSAVLAEQSFIGPQNEVQLECEAMPVRRFPDALNNYLVCRNPNAVDGGLMVRLFSGGIAGLHYGTVLAAAVINGEVVETEVQHGYMNCSR